MRKFEKLVTDQGMSMALLEYHKPDQTCFYWQGTEEDRSNGKMVLNPLNELWKWDGVVTIPAYTVAEILEILPARIEAKAIQEAFPIPEITAATGDEWDKQHDAQKEAIDKMSDFMDDWDFYNGWDLSEVIDNNGKWPYDLILNIKPEKEVLYYADDADAEYWQIVSEMKARDKHDLNLAHLLGRMLEHCLKYKVVEGDNGQGILV